MAAYYVSSGQVRTGITLNYDSMFVSSGGTANSTTVIYSGYLYVSSGGTATGIVENGGYVYVADGAEVTFTPNAFSGLVLSNWQSATVHSGTTANSTTVIYSGYLYVSSGGTANSTTVNYLGYLYVSSGGTANSTKVNSGGYLYVSSGGTANSTTVNSGGMYVYSGGTATNINWTPCVGSVYVQDGGYATFVSNYSGVYFGSADQLLSSAMTMDQKTVTGSMYVFSSGTANSTTVNYSGRLYVSSGGTANSTTVNTGGDLYVSSGGMATGVVENGGYVYVAAGANVTFTPNTFSGLVLSNWQFATVHSGTTAVSTTVNSGGRLSVSSGGMADNTKVNSGGYLYVSSGVTANSTTVNSRGYLYVSSGGTANSTKVNSGGYLHVTSGGTASIVFNPWQGTVYSSAGAVVEYLDRDANIYYGNREAGVLSKYDTVSALSIASGNSAIVYSGGTANSTTVNYGGLYVSSGGTADNTTVSGDYYYFYEYDEGPDWSTGLWIIAGSHLKSSFVSGYMCVTSGGTANSTTVNYGDMYVSGGGTANSTTVNFSGTLYVFSGGTASIVFNPWQGTVYSFDGATVEYLDRDANIYYGNREAGVLSKYDTVSALTIASGNSAIVYSGGTAHTTTVNSGGTLYVSSGGKVTGTLTMAGGAVVSAYEGSLIDFDISGLTPDAPALVNDLSLIQGTPTYTITVAAGQAEGGYKLADGAEAARFFNKSISVYCGDNELGSVIGGQTVTLAGRDYTLSLFGTLLTLTVGAAVPEDTIPPAKPEAGADITTFTNGNVTVSATFSDDSAQKQFSLDGSTWSAYTTGVVMSANGTVYFRGIDEVGNVSEVTSYTVSNIDKVAPEAPTASADITMPTNQNVTVTATFSDDSAQKQYSLDGQNFLAYDNGVVMPDNGTVYFRGIDEAGNISDVTSYMVSNINKVAPEAPTASADITTLTNQNVTVSAVFSDDSAQKQYSLDGQNFLAYDNGVVMPDNGTVYFRGINEAGNASDVTSYTVTNIDKVAPTDPVVIASTTQITNQNVTVVASFSEDSQQKQYSLNGTDWNDYTTGVVRNDNGTVYFRGIDEAGNISDVVSYEVTNIDKIPPTKPVSIADITEPTSGPVMVSAAFSSDSVKKEYSLDGDVWSSYVESIMITENGTVYFRGIDEAGNISAVTEYAVSNIEKNAPERVAGDLNADGRADIIMTIDQGGHPANGSTGAWLILGDQTAAWGDLSTRTSGWVIFGTGKTAAGKNTDDIYIKNSDNLIGAWTTNNDGKVNGWETVGEFNSETQIVGLGDFNGNGQSDLLLRNVNGAVGCFFTGGEKTGWNYFQSLGDEWKLSAIGDFNGDGRDDVVLNHDAGFAGSWLTQEDGTMAWADLDTVAEGFEIVGAGDFNGDGTDDVLLKTGNYYGAWLVNNGNAAGWFGLGDLGDVTVEQIADFNGDGVDDLRIRTSAGDLGAQLVMGEDTLDWKYYGSVGEEWKTGLAALG